MNKTPEQMAADWYIRLLTEEPAVAIKEAYQAGYQAAKDQFADADKVMPQWISVKERLPEEGRMCVVQSNWHGVLLSERIKGGWLLKKDDGHYERPTHWVSHWMSLPEPPKEEI